MRQLNLTVSARSALVNRVLFDLTAWRLAHPDFSLEIMSEGLRTLVGILFASVRSSVLSSFIHFVRSLKGSESHRVAWLGLYHHRLDSLRRLLLTLLRPAVEHADGCLRPFFELGLGQHSSRCY